MTKDQEQPEPAILTKLRELILRQNSTHVRRSVCPDDSEIGAMHIVHENSSGYLEYLSRRGPARYAGRGRWEICYGAYTLWHEKGGGVFFWSDVTESLAQRAIALLNEPPPPNPLEHLRHGTTYDETT